MNEQHRSSFWDDLDRRMQNPKFRRAYITQSLRMQGCTRWQIWKYLIINRRKK